MNSALIGEAHQSFSEDEIEELRETFDLFDIEGRGVIDLNDLKEALRSLHLDTKSPIVCETIFAINANAEINFDSFLKLLEEKLGDRRSKEGIERAFKLLDWDKSNGIDEKDLKKIMRAVSYTHLTLPTNREV
eukprot:TRINITY_DN15418_c0_g1_i1.p1 TRINITY_DN15418_c0_g1~~TRINITY_DN15418_c0_g1_i1.p1  ORF type:complete len:133 (+),score=46.23 TRINITY_DN15418_c0_g1_i1:191-589(+)